MPKKTRHQAARERKQKRHHWWQAFTHNPAFVKYRQDNLDKVKKYVAWLKKAEADSPIPLQRPADYDPEWRVIYDFLNNTPEGEAIATRLRLYPPPRPPVWPQKIDKPNRILTLEIDLSHSRTDILPALEFELRRTRWRVLGKHRIRNTPLGPPILSQHLEERQEKAFLVVEIDLQYQMRKIVKAVKTLLPRARPTGPRLKLKLKVNPWEVLDAVKQEPSFRKAAWRLGVRETTLKEAFYKAFELVHGEAYKTRTGQPVPMPEVNCKNCTQRSSCKILCPPIKAYFNQGYTGRRELLPPKGDIENLLISRRNAPKHFPHQD